MMWIESKYTLIPPSIQIKPEEIIGFDIGELVRSLSHPHSPPARYLSLLEVTRLVLNLLIEYKITGKITK
jgi:hypothetical protein